MVMRKLPAADGVTQAKLALALERSFGGGGGGGGGGTAFVQNGNAFGALAVLGTTDGNGLRVITNNVARALFDTAGNFVPPADNTGSLGTNAARWQVGRFVTGHVDSLQATNILMSPGAPGLVRTVLHWNVAGVSTIAGDLAVDTVSGQANVFVNGATETVLNSGGNAVGTDLVVGSTDAHNLSLQAEGEIGLQIQPNAPGGNFFVIQPNTGAGGPFFGSGGAGGSVPLNFFTKGSGAFVFAPGVDTVSTLQVRTTFSNAIVLDVDTSNLRVGVKTMTPLSTFHILDNQAGGNICQIENQNGTDASNGMVIIFGNNATIAGGAVAIDFVRPDGTPIGSIAQTAAGTGVVYNTTSDARLKTKIRPCEMGLAELQRIRARSFAFKRTPDRTEHGFVAQELYEVAPFAVTPSRAFRQGSALEDLNADPATDPWQVASEKLIPILVQAVQELAQEVERLKRRP